MINWPLRLFDLCIENDGACALVMVDADRATPLRDDPVYVLSATQSLSPLSEPIATYKRDLTEFVVPERARACTPMPAFSPRRRRGRAVRRHLVHGAQEPRDVGLRRRAAMPGGT